jgi:hypothetical protein
LSSG